MNAQKKKQRAVVYECPHCPHCQELKRQRSIRPYHNPDLDEIRRRTKSHEELERFRLQILKRYEEGLKLHPLLSRGMTLNFLEYAKTQYEQSRASATHDNHLLSARANYQQCLEQTLRGLEGALDNRWSGC